MWYIELLYLLLIILIIVLIFLIFTYSSYQSKNLFNSNESQGLDTSITSSFTTIQNDSQDIALIPITSLRSQKITGKFIIQLSSDSTTDIYLRAMDQGKVIGDKTRYTIWEKDSYGNTQVTLIFNSNELESGTAHDIIPQIARVDSSSTATVRLHSMSVYYY